jgi:hypothetical protein
LRYEQEYVETIMLNIINANHQLRF